MKPLITSASVTYVVDSFASVFSFDIDKSLTEAQNVEKIVHQSAFVCSVVALIQPFPLADYLVLAPLLAKMALHVGKVKGFDISQERALEIVREILGCVGLAWATGAVVASLVKMIPILGGILFAPLVYAATWAVGIVCDQYFDGMRTGVVPRADEMKEAFQRAFAEGKQRGASLKREDLEAAARDLKRRIAEREARERSPSPAGADALSVKVRERAVRKPKEEASAPPPSAERGKTIGPAPAAEAGKVAPAPDAAPEATKTIGPTGGAAPRTAGGPAGTELVNELERLAKLRESGLLTPQEFDEAKKRLLGLP